MKTNIILVTLITFTLCVANLNAAPVGSSFSYQGELIDTGSPANGSYDFIVEAYNTETGNTNLGVSQFFPSILVDNGLFNIPEVDFGDAIYDGDDIWLNIQVRKNAKTNYTTLTPRQRINAVPYSVQAGFLAANGANTDDVLQFDGSDWVGVALNNVSPWNISGSDISFSGGNVGIGTGSNTLESTLQLKGETGVDYLRMHNSATNFIDFRVADNAGIAIGPFTPGPPLYGIQVQGNVRQGLATNGFMKFMVEAECGSSGSTIYKSYNGVDDGLGATTITNGTSAGVCRIQFPHPIGDRYIQASAFQSPAISSNNPSSRGVTCRVITSLGGGILCKRFNGTGVGNNGRIMILVY